jgi:hypothetical protein
LRANRRWFFNPLKNDGVQDMYLSPEPPPEAAPHAPHVSIDDARFNVSDRLENIQKVLLKLDRSVQEEKALEIIDEVVAAIEAHKDAAEEATNSCVYVAARYDFFQSIHFLIMQHNRLITVCAHVLFLAALFCIVSLYMRNEHRVTGALGTILPPWWPFSAHLDTASRSSSTRC